MAEERRSTSPMEPSYFADTLGHERDDPRFRHGLSAPLGLAAHAAALAGILVISLLSARNELTPNMTPTAVLQFAPPPPPVLRRGALVETTPAPEAKVMLAETTVVPRPSFVMPEDVRAPTIDAFGALDGFDDGELYGMAGGVPGGVLGGVPGGVVGGIVGGTGTDVPRFPAPDVGPKPIRMPPASYTEDAIRREVRGSVRLRAVIDEKGLVHVLEVLRSIPELDAAAIETVESSWRFQPATKNGRPISCVSELVVRFNLY